MSSRALFLTCTLVLVSSILSFSQNALPPSWVYSSYLGGSQQDGITAQTRDSAGNIYVAGTTTSANFPTTAGVYEPTYPGPWTYAAIFVSKFSPEGALVWSTYLGPGCYEYIVPSGIAVDSEENVYVTGVFECGKFPATLKVTTGGLVFVSKLNSTGSELIYSVLVGGSGIPTTSPAIALDSNGNAFVTGSNGTGCCNNETGIIGSLGGIDDFWVAEFNSAGTAMTWSVEIGGSGSDDSNAIAVDSANMVYVTGYSQSLNFPVTPGTINQPGSSTFVVKLDPSKPPSSAMVYGALVGSPSANTNAYIQPFSLAVDQSGDTYISTWTYNVGMYTSPNAFQRTSATPPDGYVFELNPTASTIINGTYMGGGGADYATALSIDGSGNTYVSGFTNSWDFPVTAYSNPGQAVNSDLGYYIKLNSEFTAVSSVTFGPNGTNAWTANTDFAGGAWFSGSTEEGLFTTLNAYQPEDPSDYDGYLLHTNFAGLCETSTVAICAIAPDPGTPERIQFTAQAANVEGATSISLDIDGLVAFSSHASQFDVWLPVALGNHTATVVAQASNGSTARTQQKFNVASSSACPLSPVVPSLTICSPLNAASISGSVTIVVEANDGSVPPANIGLYVDGKFAATLPNQNGSYTDTLTLPSGNHTLSVNGKDNNGDYLQTSTVFKVQ